MSDYLIGIDNGSQSTKVSIFDEHGQVVASGRCPLRPNSTPRPGVVEHPDDDLWDSVSTACRQAMSRFGGSRSDIRGVGLCTIRFCRAMLRADGTLAHPVLSWMDARVSRAYVDNDPDVSYVTTSSGYVTARMTGRMVDTAANYAGMWPMDLRTWEWLKPGKEFDSYGIPRSKLFDLVMPGELLGTVTRPAADATGLPVGLPVYATSNDKAVEALGSGLRNEGDVLVSLGTYIAGMAVGANADASGSGFWTNYGCEPHVYLYESNGVRRGMWTVSWAVDLLTSMVQDPAVVASAQRRLDAEASEVPAGSDGLMVLPDWLAPTDAPFRKGAILGFDGRQSGAHIYRAVLEAIAMTMRLRVAEMENDLHRTFERVLLSGGGSNADVMMQIFADVWGIPAVRMHMNNAAGMGAAICAGVGSGVYPSFDAAISKLTSEDKTFEPDDANHEIYDRLLPVYGSLHESLDPVFTKSAAIFG